LVCIDNMVILLVIFGSILIFYILDGLSKKNSSVQADSSKKFLNIFADGKKNFNSSGALIKKFFLLGDLICQTVLKSIFFKKIFEKNFSIDTWKTEAIKNIIRYYARIIFWFGVLFIATIQ